MTWSDFYLFCFLVGVSLSVVSFLAGAIHLHLPFHMHLHLHGAAHHGAGHSGGTHVSWFNATTVLAVGLRATSASFLPSRSASPL